MLAGAADHETRGRPALYSIGGVLRKGTSVEQAAAALASDVQAMTFDGPQDSIRRVVLDLRPTFLRESREPRPLALALLFLFGLVTLIAGANLTSLHLARATARRRDLAIRVALGASRARLIRHLLTESMVVAGAAALVAWAASLASIGALQGTVFSLVSDAGMSMRPIHVDGRIAAAILLLAATVGIGCGLGPALHTAKSALEGALWKDARWLSGRVSAGRLRGALVVLQVALSLPLLVGAGILVRCAAQANAVEVGFDLDRIVDLRADPPSRRVLDRVHHLPGVAIASAAGMTPLTGSVPHLHARIDGTLLRVGFNSVDEHFFETLGLKITQGRGFFSRSLPCRCVCAGPAGAGGLRAAGEPGASAARGSNRSPCRHPRGLIL